MKNEFSALDELKMAASSADLVKAFGFSDDVLREWDMPIPKDSAPKGKKRGAPRGNQNARKHGLYSRLAPAPRRGDMEKALAMENLTNDIVVVRLMLANLLEDPVKNMKDIIQLFRLLTQMHRANASTAAGEAEAEAQAILERWR